MNLISVFKQVYHQRFFWIAENPDEINKAFHTVEKWGENASTESENGVKKMYAKLHKNPLFLLALPLIYIFLSYKAAQLSDKDWLDQFVQDRLGRNDD
ncbi:hypothetical protein [Aegicerativicinus sediminis]|uniref:hypothetical protein n=1 Tax=Aegicerativicinus sediminis TaxID=2893202 RepID=UPI001E5243EB|nr:hypothetical protein [Aegicerativicinus sediminis]